MVTRNNVTKEDASAHIWTEGKTDWKHLKRALEILGLDLNVYVEEHKKDMGDKRLLKQCQNHADIPHSVPIIFMFDRDVFDTVNKASREDGGFRCWGNNVYSFVIPIPSHRQSHENLSIEFYYTDDEIRTVDENGRRLFLSSEFHPRSSKHKENPNISVTNIHEIKDFTEENKAKIVASEVFNENHESIALSKEKFAANIYDGATPFDQFNFEEFRKIFDVVELIIQDARPKIDVCFAGLDNFLKELTIAEPSEEFPLILEAIFKLFRLSSLLFAAATIRFYEDEIIDEPVEFRKKVRPIKNILAENFKEPSLRTLQTLTRHCYFLVNDDAPKELLLMKECFAQEIRLDVIGHLLDDLERIFPPDKSAVKIKNKSVISKQILDYIFVEFAKYEAKLNILQDYFEDDGNLDKVHPSVWQQSLEKLFLLFAPLSNNRFSLARIKEIDPNSDSYILTKKIYGKDGIKNVKEQISKDFEVYEQDFSELLWPETERKSFHLFPFLVIHDDRLCFYQRTRAIGYEYHSLFDNLVSVTPTKKKFNRSVFKTTSRGDRQSIFWTDVIPTENEKNGIKANIPFDGLANFVGRKKQMKQIMDEIIEIPNQNGIIFGPGGVGKTALMLQLSNRLFEEKDIDEILFDNIIWISAKSDYYDHVHDVVEKRKQQFKSLDHVFSGIFDFFEYDNMEDYDLEDKKELMLELVREHKILLILDNFETIKQAERENIITFFSTDVKKVLKRKPDYFKIIVTSREQIPCGFHQIRLTGLDLKESRQLMKQVFEIYKGSKQPLTKEQEEKIQEATSGIPIVIKHCFGQIFEYNRPIDVVLNGLSSETVRVVDFSFAEIFELLKKDKIQLSIIILLDSINCPLMFRQICDILELDERGLERKTSSLVNFQCIKRVNQGGEEKYIINNEVKFFTKRLIQKYPEEVKQIRRKITENFTLERSMNYTTEELNLLYIFDSYLAEKRFLEAEDFIKTELIKHPDSVLLNFHYAKYLKEEKNDINQAIKILEGIREKSENHPKILSLLVACLTSLEVPNYNRANTYATELKNIAKNGQDIRLELGEFYVQWSTSIKIKSVLDPIKEILRQQRYKELADEAIKLLDGVKPKTHKVYHLLAQSYYNKWDYATATQLIDKALELIDDDSPQYDSYTIFRREIQKKQHQFRNQA